MTYNKETGDVIIHDPSEKKAKKKIIRSLDEQETAKRQLFDELGLDSDGFPKDKKASEVDPEELAQKHLEGMKRINAESDSFNLDPSMYYAFTKDFMRVDIGLMIQRPPIFLYMRKNDFDHLNTRQSIMEEYYCNTKQYLNEFNEVAKLNEDCLANNPYASRMNIDNYPTHRKFKGMTKRMIIDENGDELEIEEEDYDTYCAASK